MQATRTRILLSALLISAALAQAPAQASNGPSLNRSTYEALESARELMDKQQYNQALADLRALLDDLDRKYDRAVVLQTIGYAQLRKGDYKPAIGAFERALELGSLPERPTLDVRRALGRLYATTGQNEKARDALEAWLAEAESPSADDYAALANVYAQLKAYDKGIDAIRKAIRLDDKPQQSYYQLLVAMYFESKRYAEASGVLEDLIARWPQEKQYWTQLANIYINLDKTEKAHSILKLAYHKGLLTKESELLNLVQLGMAAELPDHAARVLEKALQEGSIESNRKHWQLLAQAWAQAKETDNAIEAYGQAAKFTDTGEYHLRQAQLYMQENEWPEVEQAAQTALSRGGLDSPGQAHLLIGMARVRQERYTESLAAFEKARRYEDTIKQARSWSEYARQRQQTKSLAENRAANAPES